MAKFKFSYTPENIRRIEYVLPKLKYSSYIGNVVKWLENFEEDEIQYAFDFLMFFEYIPFDELQSRLVEQISTLNKIVHKDSKILLIPFAKYVKSNDIIAYLIAKTRSYQDMASRGRIALDRDFENFKYEINTVLVFIDDFIGTGDSFLTAYNERKIDLFIGNNSLVDSNIYLLAAIVMNKGGELLHYKIPELTILAEKRVNNFCQKNSPFLISYGPKLMKTLALKYGREMVIVKRDGKDIYYPLGYGACEALVSFDYGPPNNTIPIIWSSHNWNPIFPRLADDKIKQAKDLKKSIAFFMGVMKKLKLDLYEDQQVDINGASHDYNSRIDHSLITVMYLMAKKYNEILICQIIGLTIKELNVIYQYGKSRKFIDNQNTLTISGNEFVNKLITRAKHQKFRSRKRTNFELKNLIFIPKSFKGHT